jgi:hypothetical protein
LRGAGATSLNAAAFLMSFDPCRMLCVVGRTVKVTVPLGALIVHLNDAHHWTRERIAAWVADPDVPQDESHAHH